MVARSKDLTPAIRERICELHSIGWGYKRIHTRYPAIPLSTIRYTVKKESERREGVSKPRSGRPKKLTEADKDRLLNAENMRKWRCSWRPFLKEEHALKRLQWAHRYRHFTPNDWARVFWSDECTVERGIGVRREWTFIRPKDQPREGQCQGLPHRGKQVKQMFWAAFSGAIRRTGLIPLFGDPNAERTGVTSLVIEDLYRRILPILVINQDSIFQHDNAPTHTAYVVRDALAEMQIEVMEWPPHSPDLNPIENLWALLKAKIYELRPDLLHMGNNDTTKEILVATAQQAWDELELRHLKHLSETMPHRVEAIIESQGWYTPY
ncbi:hypothetical protein N7463_001742 [Penicillium fimorum]|uniref:Tc1-like transposase DDE domain-containing protein n=1 Tax=Penicillium fimorum TaxID=1882269 RepID=A0A9W9XZ45_9EURO|nr:hypothetical protein N7463_001742 [Penicillium fimorum]